MSLTTSGGGWAGVLAAAASPSFGAAVEVSGRGEPWTPWPLADGAAARGNNHSGDLRWKEWHESTRSGPHCRQVLSLQLVEQQWTVNPCDVTFA